MTREQISGAAGLLVVRLLLVVATLAALASAGGCKKHEAAPPHETELPHETEPPSPPERPVPPPPGPRDKAAVVDDPMFHIRDDEAELAIVPAHAHVGQLAHATVTIVPGAGFHISQEYRTKLELAGAQVTTTKKNERELSFDVQATPKVAGEQQLSGFLTVGICESASCRPRRHPITVAVVGE